MALGLGLAVNPKSNNSILHTNTELLFKPISAYVVILRFFILFNALIQVKNRKHGQMLTVIL